ncbi:MAG: hypothetical protein A4E20_04710 [Nitrospira sp. SG-bin2]|uniref:hypothetical protein n=1 Tax=Nitrospira cf. moscoviensis SBR1015 TaxID=96242 RepID=UPI000A0B409D|nr:hypothetical protein [Nitrospira cf. moscoviensis SBR1015]OQW38078.1 MAG: hypothetical protein A4E20_04710 [Nitrospira sp. SG-bin2]
MIKATCGHEVAKVEDLVDIRYGGEDCDAVEGIHRCVFYATYCPACAEAAKAWPEYIANDEDEDRWLDGQRAV